MNSAAPLLTLIVPAYNAMAYLPKLLDFFAAQPMESVELLIVDDGSTDGTAAFLAKRIAQEPRLRVLCQANAGPGSARNYGIREARGKYLLFLDADDRISEDALAKFDWILSVSRGDVVFTPPMLEREDGSIVPMLSEMQWEIFDTMRAEEILQYLFEHGSWWSVWGHAFRREFLVKNHLFFPEGVYAEDLAWFPAVVLAGKQFEFCKMTFYYHKAARKGTLSSSPKMVYDLFRAAAGWLNKLPSYHLTPPVERRIRGAFVRIFYGNLWNYHRLTFRQQREIAQLCPPREAATFKRDRTIGLLLKLFGIRLTARLLELRHRLGRDRAKHPEQ